MNYSRLQILLFSLMSFVATTAVYAVDQLPEKEEDIPVEFIPTLDTAVSFGLRRLSSAPKVRFGNLGSIARPTVVSDSTTYQNTGSNYVSHVYSNGTVAADSLTQYEQTAAGNQIANGSTNYGSGWIAQRSSDGKTITVYTAINTALTDSSGNLVTNSDGSYIPNTTTTLITNSDGTTTLQDSYALTWASTMKYLAYNSSQTRYWSATNQSQVRSDGTVAMSAYGVQSSGYSLNADSSGSTGFELSFERRLGKRSHWEWGVSGSFKLCTINAKAAGIIPAYLIATTDIYKMVDTGLNSALLASTKAGNAVYDTTTSTYVGVDKDQPSGNNAANLSLYDLSGNLVYKYSSSSSTPLSYTSSADISYTTPLDVTSVKWGDWDHPDILGTALVHGTYQLKGAYYLGHFGPSVRYRFNDRWAVSATAGLAIAYVGTTYKAEEWVNTYADFIPYSGQSAIADSLGQAVLLYVKEENTTHKIIPGLYYDANIEYWMTERTGFYWGVTGQSMRSFQQNKLSGRTATIDMGTNTGWRMGIITRF